MFSNKNNKFIKKQNAGDPPPPDMSLNIPLNMPPGMPPPQNMDMPPGMPPGMPPSLDMSPPFSESYPNLDYLYDNITSQETHDNIKTYICAFTVNTELNTHFVKYVVEQNELFASLPFFQFTSAEVPQQVELQMPPQVEPQIPGQMPPQMPQQVPGQMPPQVEPQIPGQMPPQMPPQVEPQMPPQMPPQVEPQMPPQVEPQMPPQMEPQMPPQVEQQMPQQPPPQMPQQPPPPQIQPPQMFGGYKDDSKTEEEIDIIFKKKTIEFVKTMFQDPSEPTYIGYIPNVSESNAVFVFVKIQNPFVLNLKYIECIPNELVFLSKVYNLEVEQPIKNLFANNPWLYMNQNLASPFSGYLCRKNEQNQIMNVKKEEISTTNLYDQYLINIDEIGSYYYFSFLPFDLQNTELYQRFALFPIEYDCILDNDNLVYYKQNMINFENSDSIYFKGDILTDKKEGMQFFVLKTPLQFTKI